MKVRVIAPPFLEEGGTYAIEEDVWLHGQYIHVECWHKDPTGWTFAAVQGDGWAEARLLHNGVVEAITRVAL